MVETQMPSPPRFFASARPRLIGHRGSAGTAPENTMCSFERAVQDGATILEMDVRLTKDGHVVVCHDETVDRTTDGAGPVRNFTLAEIQKLDAGYRFQSQETGGFPFRDAGIKIPALTEVLQSFPNVPLVIEIKSYDAELIDKTLALLRQFNRLDDGSVLIASFHHRVLRRVRKAVRKLPTSFSVREVATTVVRVRAGFYWKRKRRTKFVFQTRLNRGRWRIVTPRTVRAIQALGFEVHVWTINDAAEMRRLLAMGVDGIFTDYPARLRRVIDELERERR